MDLNEEEIQRMIAQQSMPAPRAYGVGNALMQGAKGFLGNRDLALALLSNSGYSPNKRSFGETLGTSMLQANQAQRQRSDEELRRRFLEAQIGAMDNKGQGPASVQEYQYAVKNGYKGSFQDWVVAGGQSSRPSAVQEWEFYNKLPDTQKPLYLEMKRNPNFTVKDVNQVPNSIQQSIVGGVTVQPLSNLSQTAAAAEKVKQAEGRGGAFGKTEGEIAGGIQTKGSNAVTVLDMTQEARKLLKDSTGSVVGTGVDKIAGGLGYSTKGAQTGGRLKVLQAAIMTNMPRMEGPQSDRDVDLYRQAAAQIGDTTIPTETRAAALDTIDYLQKKYVERAGSGKEDPLGIR